VVAIEAVAIEAVTIEAVVVVAVFKAVRRGKVAPVNGRHPAAINPGVTGTGARSRVGYYGGRRDVPKSEAANVDIETRGAANRELPASNIPIINFLFMALTPPPALTHSGGQCTC